MANLGEKNRSKRNDLRTQMYERCRDGQREEGIVSNDGAVGSGKTTAVMAYQLNQAVAKGARRIFVVLPYTNVITQSVEVYRNALVLPGEEREAVVAELHCKADFEDEDTRCLTSLWRAPIIVTTAVAFFETLASNRPGALRRLHELPHYFYGRGACRSATEAASACMALDEGIGRRVELSLDFGIRLAGSFLADPGVGWNREKTGPGDGSNKPA